MRHGQRLLQFFLLALAAYGVGPEGLDAWRGWVAFKAFARRVAEVPDPGVSVQILPDSASGEVHLALVHQVLAPLPGRRKWLRPIGGVVCEFAFAADVLGPRRVPQAWEAWTFDHRTFEHFVDAVEQHPDFQDLVVRPAVRTDVYWERAYPHYSERPHVA